MQSRLLPERAHQAREARLEMMTQRVFGECVTGQRAR
jgi:hypothetical protein